MAKIQPRSAQKKVSDAQRRLRFTVLSRLSHAMAKEYSLQGVFKLGYRNKEDISNLPPYVLSVGSQNVLTNAAEQIVIRNGYQLDGPAGNQNTYGIDSAYDFNTHTNGVQNIRKWGTNMEVRYVNPITKAVSWINIKSDLSATYVVNFTDYWDTTELKNLCLFVNHDSTVGEWSGGVGAFASATATTLTLSANGSADTLALQNFYQQSQNQGKMKVLINGTTYTYTSAGLLSVDAINNHTGGATQDLGTYYVSQMFTTGASAKNILTALVDLQQLAAIPLFIPLTGYLYTDNAGVPGTLLKTIPLSAPAVAAGSNFSVTFDFGNFPVSAATNYHFVIKANMVPSVVNLYTGTTGSVGTNRSTDASSWSAVNGYMNLTVTENDAGVLQFLGVTPDPSAAGIAVGDAVIQKPCVGAQAQNSNTTFPTSFTFDLIGTLRNQVYYGSFNNQTIYISKVNDYTNTNFSTPRIVGEGANATLDAPPVGFIAEEDAMYVTAGRDYWYRSLFTLSSDLAKESFQFSRLKTSFNQAAQTQGLIGKLKNTIVYVSNEQIINAFGPVKDVLAPPQVVNMSDSIKYDVDAYDFTGGQVFYDNYFVYITIPVMGIVRIFNVQKKYWEAPQVLPFSRFYHVSSVGGNVLYAHSYLTNESYQCFVAGVHNDNGNPINAIAAFPYVSSEGAQPAHKKFFNKHYTEGYIAGNTTLTLTINYDFGGFSGSYSSDIGGNDTRIIFNKITDGSLGKNSLGTQPIGTILNLPNPNPLPKFRKISTFPPTHNFEYQIVYSSNDVDQDWALLRFGPAIGPASDVSPEVTE